MSKWEQNVLTRDENVDFLDELNGLDSEDVVEAIQDAIVLASSGDASDDELSNGLAAATIAAIWAGAPFSAGDVVGAYPFIRELVGTIDEDMNEKALVLLEDVEEDYDLEAFIEALS